MDSDTCTVRKGKGVLGGWTQEARALNWAAPVLPYSHPNRTSGELLPWKHHLLNQQVPANRTAKTTGQKCHCASQRIKTLCIISLLFMSFLSSVCYPTILRLCKDRSWGGEGLGHSPATQGSSWQAATNFMENQMPQSLFLKQPWWSLTDWAFHPAHTIVLSLELIWLGPWELNRSCCRGMGSPHCCLCKSSQMEPRFWFSSEKLESNLQFSLRPYLVIQGPGICAFSWLSH